MGSKPSFFVTTAISYVNGAPHLGHAYEAISTDMIARFKRLDGYDVKFLTGTDEHGQKVEKTARAAGQEPQELCDEIASLFRGMADDLNISNDDFIRTTEARHYRSVQAIWSRLQDKGDLYLDSYAGWYSVRDEAFFGDDELTRDADGNHFAPGGAKVEWVEEPSYFFRLSDYTEKLLAYYEAHPDFIQPAHRRNEIVNFVKQGLTDLSVSRTSFDWGVPVPGDDNHIMYVWLDALTNYITALGFPDMQATDFQTYWPAQAHIVGKDIMRFHTIYWPAFLMSAELPLPKTVFGHGFLTIEGQKMSKSLGNVVTPQALVEEFGLDQTRYFLMREVPYGQDGSFSRDAIIQRINSDLANDFGNLAQRVLSMVQKNCGAEVPQPGPLNDDDIALRSAADDALAQMRAEMDRFALHRALESVWKIVADANRYIDAQAPWALRKTDPARMATVLYVLADVIRQLGLYAQAVMPDAANKLLDLLVVPADQRDFAALERRLVPGTALPKPEPLFPRYISEDGE